MKSNRTITAVTLDGKPAGKPPAPLLSEGRRSPKGRVLEELNAKLFVAASEGEAGEVARLLKAGANVNAKDNGVSGWTALMYAAGKENKEVVELLIDWKADVNAKDHAGRTALMYAVRNGRTEVAELLIHKGANVNAKAKDGWTVLIQVAVNGYKEVAELLIAHKADVNAEDGKGWTALLWANWIGHKEIVELLKKHGAKEQA